MSVTTQSSVYTLPTPHSDHGARLERAVLLAMGWPAPSILALERQAKISNSRLIETAVAQGLIDTPIFYERIASALAFKSDAGRRYRIISHGVPQDLWRLLQNPAPVSIGEGEAGFNAQSAPIEMLTKLSQQLGANRNRIRLLTRQSLINAMTRTFGPVLQRRAVHGLRSSCPELSAVSGLAAWQAAALPIMGGLFVGALAVEAANTVFITALATSCVFILAIALRVAAAVNLVLRPPPPETWPSLADADLPAYTVFVPLFREAAILPHLANALQKLDYPPAKLDIKLVLESIDIETIAAAIELNLPGNVDLIVVPDSQPRTKPKALNYALQFATGDLAVIFDAEDRPEPDQLRKAATLFHHSPPDIVCLQARLDYFNAKENWLSRQFTIEYATLFRGLLPFFDRFGLPLPLGGTSNHFRIEALRHLRAWDPFNVTEDADLGMRLHRAGYRAATLDSTTYEEACCQTIPWIKQRTRWLKGWMQTYGVHTRQPFRTVRESGLAGFIAFHAYAAGVIVSALAHPVFYGLFVWQAATGQLTALAANQVLLSIALANFVLGYASNIALAALSLRATTWKGLTAYSLFIPVYWLLISTAAYRAAWQLVWAPFYWEKTSHGVSKQL